MTLNKTIKNLVDMELIDYTMKFNKFRRDKTKWFAFDEAGCQELESIRVISSHPSIIKKESIYSKYSLKNVSVEVDEEIEAWAQADTPGTKPVIPTLFPVAQPTKIKPNSQPIVSSMHRAMYRICYRAETEQEILTLDSGQRGRVSSALGRLTEAGADLNKLHDFVGWWNTNWRSKDKGSNSYQPPRPDQVVEHWWVAMKANQKQIPDPVVEPKENVIDLDKKMLERAMIRRNGDN